MAIRPATDKADAGRNPDECAAGGVSNGVRVLLADDHPAIRSGVAAALENAGFTVCAQAADAGGAVEAALREHPDVCLLDIDMPGNGISAAREITARLPVTVVIMLTVSRDDSDVFEALMAGASGYLLKEIDSERLALALEGVLNGEAAMPRALAGRLVREFRARERRRLSLINGRRVRLTDREWEVLEMMRTGLSNSEMAERLLVSSGTVRSHVHSILRKLRVPHRADAIQALEGR